MRDDLLAIAQKFDLLRAGAVGHGEDRGQFLERVFRPKRDRPLRRAADARQDRAEPVEAFTDKILGRNRRRLLEQIEIEGRRKSGEDSGVAGIRPVAVPIFERRRETPVVSCHFSSGGILPITGIGVKPWSTIARRTSMIGCISQSFRQIVA